MSITFPAKTFVVVPTIVPAAYGAGDQLGTEGKYELDKAVMGPGDSARLKSLAIFDGAKQKAALDILFWNGNPTIASTDNNPFDVSDAEGLAKFVGFVSVVTGDWVDLANNSVATKNGLNLLLASLKGTANPLGVDLYVSLVNRGTPTYVAANDIKIRLSFE